MIRQYIKHNLIALDQSLNAMLGGWPDETLSARAWRRQWRLRYVIDLLFFRDRDENGKRNHCQASYEYEKARMDLPPEYRTSLNAVTDHLLMRKP